MIKMKNLNIKINLCIHYLSALGVGVAILGYIETTFRIHSPLPNIQPRQLYSHPLPNLHTLPRIQAQCTKRKSCEKTK